MSERAVGADGFHETRSIELRVVGVEGRMTHLENDVAQHMRETKGLLETVIKRLGQEADGPTPASGLYSKVDSVSGRLAWFEKFREQGRGALIALLAITPPAGAVVWFLAGVKLTKVFHG